MGGDGRVYTVTSAKGGVGKSTTAANLGAMFGASNRETVVVDADLATPALTSHLDCSSSPSLHDVLAGETEVDEALVEHVGFDVLPGTPGAAAFAGVDIARLRPVVGTLRERYDVVVVDGGPGLSHDTVVPMQLADRVLLATTPDEASVEAAATTAEVAERVDARVEGCVVVKVTDRDQLDDVRRRLDAPIAAAVPRDDAVPRSQDLGKPVVVAAPSAPAAKAYWALAGRRPETD
ncbi:MinD/ParA family ATP-binding protein [Halomarina rubra]|uniref:MinD/ParA family protein n=1 Tax=Halomarina rubra TaxID=2071873 RepID=A0ABD6ASU2_9EURY|nr:MinD/ParA family protein [Halomarina rubra]